MEFFGVGKQQELASILAASAVKVATPVGRRDTDRRRPMAFVVPDDEAL